VLATFIPNSHGARSPNVAVDFLRRLQYKQDNLPRPNQLD